MLLTLGYSNVRAFFFKTKWYGYRLETCVGIIIHLDIHVVSCHWWFISSLLKDHWFFFTVKNVYWFSFMPWPILKMKRYTTKVLASTGKVVSFLLSPSTGLYFLSSWLLELKKITTFKFKSFDDVLKMNASFRVVHSSFDWQFLTASDTR